MQGQLVLHRRVLGRVQPVAARRVGEDLVGLGRVVVGAAEVHGPPVGEAGQAREGGGCPEPGALLVGEVEETAERGPLGVDPAPVVERLIRLLRVAQRVDPGFDEQADGMFEAGGVAQDALLAVMRRPA